MRNGLRIAVFPCNQFGKQEPGKDIVIKYRIARLFHPFYDIYAKINVNEPNPLPLYKYLVNKIPFNKTTRRIRWNFTKFLVNRKGIPIKRFEPWTEPATFEPEIVKALAETWKFGGKEERLGTEEWKRGSEDGKRGSEDDKGGPVKEEWGSEELEKEIVKGVMGEGGIFGDFG